MKIPFEEFIYNVGIEAGQKYNSCHNPAGGPTGGQFCAGGGGGGTSLSTEAKEAIASRIRGLADFSREKDVRINLQESVSNPGGGSSVNVIARLRGSAKDFRSFTASQLDNVTRSPNRITNRISINWSGRNSSNRSEVNME